MSLSSSSSKSHNRSRRRRGTVALPHPHSRQRHQLLPHLEPQPRLATNGINQLIRPKMAHLGNNGGDGTEQHAGHGHQAIIHPIDPPIPIRKPALHILPQARALHLLFAGPHADEVVVLVEVEVEKGEQDADEAQGAVEAEGGREQRVRLRGRHVGGVEHAGGEGDGEVGWEEVGFEEAVEEDEEFGFGEAGARVGAGAGGVRGVDVGGGEGGAGGGGDPVGDTVEGAVLGEGVSWLVFF